MSGIKGKPNILWIMTDQQRYDSLGCTGNDIAETPNIDSLAADGLLFENAYCQSPVCMASRAALFTGRYPSAIGMRGMGILPPREVTTAEVLQRNGYSTGAFGKLHFTPELYTLEVIGSDVPVLDWRQFARDANIRPVPYAPYRERYGFQTHVGCEDNLKGEHRAWLRRMKPDLLEAEKGKPGCEGGPGDLYVSPYPSEYHESAFIAGQAARYIKRKAGKGPWFAFCSFIAPHHPFEAPREHINRFPKEAFEPPPDSPPSEKQFIPEKLLRAWGETALWDRDARREVMRHYYASINLIDDCVGELLCVLRETGQVENTIIVYNSDHGEFLLNRGLIRKPSIHYDDILKVPLIINLPQKPKISGKAAGLVQLLDLHPTLLSLAGLEINPGVQGIDLSKNIMEQPDNGREHIYSESYEDPVDEKKCLLARGGPYTAVQTLRTRALKLNVYPAAGQEYGQLFDLERDPGETRNLYNDPSCRHIREKMLWRLNAEKFSQVDPLPLILSQW